MKLKDRKEFWKEFNSDNFNHIKYPRKQQQFYIRKYTDDEFKICCLKSVRAKGNEERTLEGDYEKAVEDFENACAAVFDDSEKVSRETFYRKHEASISRTKRVIYELARCNKWDYVVTLTLNPEWVDRENMQAILSRMKTEVFQKINNQITGEDWGRQKKVEYLLIPEIHPGKGIGFHFHGFIRGLEKYDLRTNKNGKLEWKQWADAMGYTCISPIRSAEASAKYATKYITKDMLNTIKEKGANAYYHSKGLNRAELVYSGGGQWFGEWQFTREDGFCAVSTVTRQQLKDNFVGEWGECIEL